jgi:P4 family phage/plasmid primase-like protien
LTYSNSKKFNERADFLLDEIGVNPLPADTQNKRIIIKWGEHQNESIPIQVHESRKQNGEYDKGITVMTGRLYKGKNKGKYLVGIDCDNKKAIDEICEKLGFKDIDELSKWTWTEQHKDNLNKAHIYILSTKPLMNKGRDPKFTELESRNQVPAIEVKCERQNMFTAPSIHQDGYPYEILGIQEPVLCDVFESHLDNIFRKYNIDDYLINHNVQESVNNNYNSNNNLPEPLRSLINWLVIPKDFQYQIHEGARHSTMLSFANKLLIKHKYNSNISRDELKKFFYEVNNNICIPTPLPDNEIKTIWRDALRFSEDKISNIKIVNDDENDPSNYKTQVIIPLEIGDKLLEKEIIQNLVYDLQTNSIDCRLNSKYKPGTRVIVPISIKQWPDVRKNFKKECLEKGIDEEDTLLLLESIDNNVDLIKKHYLENHRKHNAVLAAASEERKKQRLELIEEGTEFVMAKYRFLTIEESNEILFYDSNRGVYVSGGHIVIDKEIDKKYGYKLKTNDINEIKKYVQRKTYVKKESFDSNVYIINFTNGLYNWRTGQFMPHTPDYYSLNQKPFPYNPKTKSKLIGKFLSEVLHPTDIRTALEMIAYTFIRANLFDYYFILIGTGANGKSVFVGVLSHLDGFNNISNVSLHELVTDRFALADLENKDVNVDTELSNNTKDISILKKLTGRQPLRIQRKGQQAYDVLLWAKLIFNANQLPSISDQSDARYRREIIIPFPRQFQGKDEDPNLLKKLTIEEELSGIFNIITKCLRTIDAKGKIYVNSKSINERREKAELIHDPLKSFIDKAIAKDSVDSDYETKDDFYLAYTRYCKFHKLPIQQKETLGSILNKKPYGWKDGRKMTDGIRKTIWKGVRLKQRWKSDDIFLQQTLDGSGGASFVEDDENDEDDEVELQDDEF